MYQNDIPVRLNGEYPVTILDYGIGNILSVSRVLKLLELKVILASNIERYL